MAWRTTLQPSLMKSRRTVLSRRCRGSLSFLGAGIAASPLILIQLKAIGESLGRLLRWRKDSWEGRGSPMGGGKTGALENFLMWAKLPPPVDRSPIRGRMMASGRCSDGAAPCPTAASLPSRKAGLHKGVSSVGRDVLTGCAKLNGRDGNLLGECSLSFFFSMHNILHIKMLSYFCPRQRLLRGVRIGD